MKTVPIIFMLALAGCASPGDLRMKMPAVEASSAKQAKTVAGCIADKWEAANHKPPISARPTSAGYSLTAGSDLGLYGKDTSFVIDVADGASGSTTKFYSNIALSSGTELVGYIVRECQK
jgi:hypothetical protein